MLMHSYFSNILLKEQIEVDQFYLILSKTNSQGPPNDQKMYVWDHETQTASLINHLQHCVKFTKEISHLRSSNNIVVKLVVNL